ncbi:hypothetical protein MKX01_037675 [Papaver californicum]|nr:hypothetical protein MKX01_037675 [Papaver californicum]
MLVKNFTSRCFLLPPNVQVCFLQMRICTPKQLMWYLVLSVEKIIRSEVEWTAEKLEQTAEAIGYGAVKFANLKNNRETDYIFSYDQMLNDKGNTVVKLHYTHARSCSIISKSGQDIKELKKTGTIVLDHAQERTLGLYLLLFAEPNVLCKNLYSISEHFTKFYDFCQVVGSPEETSRLLLCEATAVVMRQCFHLLGIVPVYKI